jgi:hypothetical protein
MAAHKFLTLSAGRKTEEAAISTSGGGTDEGKIPCLNASGILDDSITNASATAVAGKLAKLDGTGRLSSDMMPVGIGADTLSIVASEALSAGNWVNIWNDTGTPKVRKADATTSGKEADGFVLAAFDSAATALVYFEGSNTQKTSLTIGARYYLNTTAGGEVATAPSASGNVVQYLGRAVSATQIVFEGEDGVILA